MKQLILIIILVIFLSILVGANIYISRRFSLFFDITNLKMLYVITGFLTIFMIAGVMGASNSISFTGHIIYIIAGITMGLLLYLLISTILVDVIRLFTNFKPLVYGLIIIGFTLSVSIYGIWNSFNLKVTKIDIPVSGLTNDIKAMHLSDIHIGHFRGRDWLQQIVDKTNKQNVDVVFITGDLFDGRINMNLKTLEPLKKLNAPVYFVEGNHDGYSGVNEIKSLLREIGVDVLENEVTHFGEIQIIGLVHMLADSSSVNMHSGGHSKTIKSVLATLNINKDKPTVLLHHSPDGIQFANENGIDVYLAGHTHGGQLFPINYIANLIFKYNKGLHDYNGTKIFVTEGAGTFGPPMRVATKSEITVINLNPIKK
ncbi:MAG: metallophosphoesterase [Bacteroidetes bacterium]|nr:metallophosphoesterase [Bacteroidota bacterium]